MSRYSKVLLKGKSCEVHYGHLDKQRDWPRGLTHAAYLWGPEEVQGLKSQNQPHGNRLMSPQITTHRFVFLSMPNKRDRAVPVVGAKLLAVASDNPRYSLMS